MSKTLDLLSARTDAVPRLPRRWLSFIYPDMRQIHHFVPHVLAIFEAELNPVTLTESRRPTPEGFLAPTCFAVSERECDKAGIPHVPGIAVFKGMLSATMIPFRLQWPETPSDALRSEIVFSITEKQKLFRGLLELRNPRENVSALPDRVAMRRALALIKKESGV